MIELCAIQHKCPIYESGDNKPPNNDIRDKVPCRRFLACDCEMCNTIEYFIREKMGLPIACNLEKVRKMREQDAQQGEVKRGET